MYSMRRETKSPLNQGLPTHALSDGIFMPVRIQSHKARNPPSKHGNGSAQVGGDYERPEEAMGCCLSHSEAIVFGSFR